MNRLKLTLWIIFAFFIAQSCNQHGAQGGEQEGMDSGTAKFAVDESFKPIVDQEVYVFTQLNVKAKPVMLYRTENDVLRLLLNDSLRLVVLSRNLTSAEVAVLKSRSLPPEVSRFAIDGIALIVNQASADTLITVDQLKKMLSGDTKTTKSIVLDNPNSSLARYLKDFAGIKQFGPKNIYSLKNNKEVIKYISQNQNAIGIVGFSWLDDPDADYADAVSKVKVMGIKDESSKAFGNQYFTPSQNTLALKQYPLTRGLYVINATGKLGLGTGFAHFLVSEKGQRIILRSGILPDSIPQREIRIKHTY